MHHAPISWAERTKRTAREYVNRRALRARWNRLADSEPPKVTAAKAQREREIIALMRQDNVAPHASRALIRQPKGMRSNPNRPPNVSSSIKRANDLAYIKAMADKHRAEILALPTQAEFD